MLGLIVDMAKELVSIGHEKLREKKEFGRLQNAVQERLRREIRFNLAMVDEAMRVKNGNEGGGHDALLGALSSGCFDEIGRGGIPLDLFFSTEALEKSVWPVGGNEKQFSAADIAKYKVRIESIQNQAELLERLYHRIAVMRALAEKGVAKGDVKYLSFLLRAANKTFTG